MAALESACLGRQVVGVVNKVGTFDRERATRGHGFHAPAKLFSAFGAVPSGLPLAGDAFS